MVERNSNMERKQVKYHKHGQQDYRVTVGREETKFGNSRQAKKFYKDKVAENTLKKMGLSSEGNSK
jgi:hypothetical protein